MWSEKLVKSTEEIKTKLEEYSLEQRAPLLGGSTSRNQYSSEESEDPDSIATR